MNREFPKSVTRKQIVDALAVLGIDARSVADFHMRFKTLHIDTPYYMEDDVLTKKSIEIPVEDS